MRTDKDCYHNLKNRSCSQDKRCEDKLVFRRKCCEPLSFVHKHGFGLRKEKGEKIRLNAPKGLD